MKDKKEVTLRARVSNTFADEIAMAARKQGMMHITAYIRLALLEKMARDSGKTIEEIINN